MGYYDTAQICMNGHVTNPGIRSLPYRSKAHCDKCGAETTTTCPTCNSSIRGGWVVSRYSGATCTMHSKPAFCEMCGNPYSWTQSTLEAASDLADQLGLDIPERALLDKSIEELVRDTPLAPAGAVRFKSIVVKSQPWGLEAFKQVLGGVVGEAAKRLIWGA